MHVLNLLLFVSNRNIKPLNCFHGLAVTFHVIGTNINVMHQKKRGENYATQLFKTNFKSFHNVGSILAILYTRKKKSQLIFVSGSFSAKIYHLWSRIKGKC